MLNVTLKIQSQTALLELCGDISNISRLAALSDYELWFESRAIIEENTLRGYPRRSESVLGLVARCLALTRPGSTAKPLPADWTTATLSVFLVPGGRGEQRLISEAELWRNDAGGIIDATSKESGIDAAISYQAAEYEDGWDLAAHALRMLTFGSDAMPVARALEVPVLTRLGMKYIRWRDIPNKYVRAEFEIRQQSSGRPSLDDANDACWPWDWDDWVNGQR